MSSASRTRARSRILPALAGQWSTALAKHVLSGFGYPREGATREGEGVLVTFVIVQIGIPAGSGKRRLYDGRLHKRTR
jgi:hypothetical protein